MKARKHERGIALVIVLWVGLLVVAIAGAFIVDTRNSTQLTRNFLDNAEARAMADGGIHLAIYELMRPDDEKQWRRDGRRYRRVVPGGTLDIVVEDEVGKIDLNNAGDELLEGLFLSAGINGDSAGAIIQAIDKFREEQEERERRRGPVNGSKAQIKFAVEQLNKSTGRNNTSNRRPDAASQAFLSVDSLGRIPGITAELHALLRPALTVFGNSGLDYMTSPREALLAIPGISAESVDNFLAKRAGDDVDEPLEEFLAQGRARDHWQEAESNTVTVKVLAQSGNGAKFVRIAIVELTIKEDQPFIVKEWREGDAQSIQPYTPEPAEAGEIYGGST